ncbi:LysR family transcriptional regulator [Luteibacter rhizovicinus]|uniref:LysR family transcriptional regulator n=1 Tax=Luteibacter rhizovicinus TaxID=242606 RepID=A0A4R3YSY8_9GAMM|nr:LysR substrate-binding domain-containing protein [Luteibacter rhizovicinus]TCV96027.1 LysR family transcriptional regulator [Luteibacter rhizovicinus]
MGIRLDIALLRNFVAIADATVMSRAAEQVGRTQAALSQQVKKLEQTIEQPLMIRTGRGVSLTIHGERLLAHAHKILRMHDEAVAELTGATLSGQLRFGCPDDYARIFLPGLLQSFARLHPQVFIEVVCASTPRLLERLKGQSLDIAITSLPDSPERGQFLRCEPFVWVGRKGSDAFNLDPLQLALSDPDALDHVAATSSLDRAGRSYRIAYASGSVAGLTAVVRSGQAITVMTLTGVPPDLQVLPPSSGLPPLPSVGITVQTASRSPSRLLSRFEAHVRSVLPTL